MERRLTITLNPDWQGELRAAAARGLCAGTYTGSVLNFPTPRQLFARLTPNRWAMLETLQHAGEPVGVRELARRLGRDVKRVHEDAMVLADLSLIERTATGALVCPYAEIHIDMLLSRRAA